MMDKRHGFNTSLNPLYFGFFGSLIFLFAAYFLVTRHAFSGIHLIICVVALGAFQALLQLVFFFHLGVEEKPRWGLMTFLFMLLIIVILMGGTLWIMNNLDYNMMLMKMQ